MFVEMLNAQLGNMQSVRETSFIDLYLRIGLQ